MKRVLSVLALLCALATGAQTGPQPLTVGDTVPPGLFAPLCGGDPARLPGFSGGVLLLDFWATWCTSCLYSFPRLQALQDSFGPRLKVLLINGATTHDGAGKVAAFFEKRRRPTGAPFSLDGVVGDTVLTALFPHKLLPHYVWIRGGRVVAITGSEEVTAPNLQALLEGRDPGLRLKQDVPDFDGSKPLLSQLGAAGWGALQHHSLLTGRLDGLPAATGLLRDSARGAVRLFFTNASPLSLLQYAWNTHLPPSRMVGEGERPTRLLATEGPEGSATPTFSYELTLPLEREGERHRFMQEDLERYFSLSVTLEVRPLKCLVLREEAVGKGPGAGKGKGKKRAGGGRPAAGEGGVKTFSSPAHLAEVLSYQLPLPVVSEVKGARTFKLPRSEAGDLAHWRKVLRNQNLTLVEEERPLEVLVVRDAPVVRPPARWQGEK